MRILPKKRQWIYIQASTSKSYGSVPNTTLSYVTYRELCAYLFDAMSYMWLLERTTDVIYVRSGLCYRALQRLEMLKLGSRWTSGGVGPCFIYIRTYISVERPHLRPSSRPSSDSSAALFAGCSSEEGWICESCRFLLEARVGLRNRST